MTVNISSKTMTCSAGRRKALFKAVWKTLCKSKQKGENAVFESVKQKQEHFGKHQEGEIERFRKYIFGPYY